MAKFSKGYTFYSNEGLSQEKLHSLIDTAIATQNTDRPGTPQIYDIGTNDLASPLRAIHTASSPSSPASNDLAVGSDGQLDVYDGAAFQDLSVNFMYLINNTSFTLVTGSPVAPDYASAANCKLWTGTGICYEPLGVSMGVFAPSATAKIQTSGVAMARINNPFTVGAGDRLGILAAGATALSKLTAAPPSEKTEILAICYQIDTASALSGICLALLVH